MVKPAEEGEKALAEARRPVATRAVNFIAGGGFRDKKMPDGWREAARSDTAIPAKSKARKFNDATKQGENGWLSTSLACVSWSWAHDVSVFVVRSESIESVLVPMLSRTTMSHSFNFFDDRPTTVSSKQ